MLQCARRSGRPREPVVTERHTGQIHPRLRGVDDAGQPGKGQVTAQNAMRAAAGQRGEELLRAGHPMTVAHQVWAAPWCDVCFAAARGVFVRCTTLDGYVWNRRLRRAASCLRHRRRRAAPDGVPRLRLVGRRAARRRRRADGASPGGTAGQPRGRAGRDRRGEPRRQHRPRPHPLGHPRPADRPQRPPAPRRRGQDRGRPQRDHRELRAAARRTGGRPASSSPATPTPRSPCTWSSWQYHHGRHRR